MILPTFNHGKFIENSIRSIIKNCSRTFELIIINDGSTDGTDKILQQYSSDPRITVIEQENIGLAESLNKGFKLARGRYLTWTSADNLYKNSALDSLAGFLDRYADIDMVYADVELIDDNSKLLLNSDYRIPNQNKNKSYLLNLPQQPETLLCFADNFINACFMYRSWIPKALGNYRKDLLGYEDYEYWLRILCTGKIAHLDSKQSFYQYRVHTESLTKQLNAAELSRKQREVVGKYYQLHNNKSLSEHCEPDQIDIIESDTTVDFLKSLPLEYKFEPSTKLSFNFTNSLSYECETPIDCPEILTRAIEADYKAHSLVKKTKLAVSILIPDFLVQTDLEILANFIDLNRDLTFIAVCNSIGQNRNAESIISNISNQNLKIINLTQSPSPPDQHLPEEKFLPFVYAFANTELIISPVNNSTASARAVCSLAAKLNLDCILIGSKSLEVPVFAEVLSWEDLLKRKIKLNTQSDGNRISHYKSWLKSISSKTYLKKIEKLKNFSKLYNFSIS